MSSVRQRFRYNKAKIGAKPGTILIADTALSTRIFVHAHQPDYHLEEHDCTLDRVNELLDTHGAHTVWVDIRGVKNPEIFDWLHSRFDIHPLELEDINSAQQPKVEFNFGHLYAISRMLYSTNGRNLMNEQLTLFLCGDVVITIQHNYDDVLEPVRNRIRDAGMPMRKRKSEYLVYAIFDAIVDNYFSIVSDLGEQLELLEDQLLSNASRKHRNEILQLKHELMDVRRIIWPEREKINNLIRHNHLNKQENLEIYLQDLSDHLTSLIDLVESYRETAANLMDLYMANVSNRMNEIMKVLTMLSAIFIPLSFVAGLYGMNFATHNARGENLPLNMPELYSPYGYVGVLVFMGLSAVGLLLLFWRRGWFNKW